MDDKRLKEEIKRTGSSFERLIKHHDKHYKSLDAIIQTFKDRNINTRVTQRFNYSLQDIQWADAIFTAGGDGTFLLAAAKIADCKKPLIGINTDSCKIYTYISKFFNNNLFAFYLLLLNSKFGGIFAIACVLFKKLLNDA